MAPEDSILTRFGIFGMASLFDMAPTRSRLQVKSNHAAMSVWLTLTDCLEDTAKGTVQNARNRGPHAQAMAPQER